MKFFLIILCLISCSNENYKLNMYLEKDTTILINENLTGLESHFKLSFEGVIQDDITIETISPIFSVKTHKPESLYSSVYKIPKGKIKHSIVQDYGTQTSVIIKGLHSKILFSIEAPSYDSLQSIKAVSTKVSKL